MGSEISGRGNGGGSAVGGGGGEVALGGEFGDGLQGRPVSVVIPAKAGIHAAAHRGRLRGRRSPR